MSNFNIRKFLTENKLTQASQHLTETEKLTLDFLSSLQDVTDRVLPKYGVRKSGFEIHGLDFIDQLEDQGVSVEELGRIDSEQEMGVEEYLVYKIDGRYYLVIDDYEFTVKIFK